MRFNKLIKHLLSRTKGKTADIHQKSLVEFVYLTDLTNIALPILHTPNKSKKKGYGMAHIIFGLMFIVLFIPAIIWMIKDGDMTVFFMMVLGIVSSCYFAHFGWKTWMDANHPVTLAIYEDRVAFLSGMFKRELISIGFDRAYLAEFHSGGYHHSYDTSKYVEIWLCFIEFSDDGLKYWLCSERIADFYIGSDYQNEEQVIYLARVINALILQYQKTHPIKHMPQIKYIAQK